MDSISEYLKAIGAKGGKAGKGESKRRGNKAYYKAISQKAIEARKKKNAQKPPILPSAKQHA